MSYRLLRDGDFVAHCNITTQPGRPIDKPLTLHDFETEVAQSLDEKVEEVASANEWDTASGCRCLAVIVRGPGRALCLGQLPLQAVHSLQ